MASPVAIAAQVGKLLRGRALRPPLLAVRSQAGHLTPRRWLNLQEYQSKKLMSEHGVRVQRFFVANTAKEALEAAKRLSSYLIERIHLVCKLRFYHVDSSLTQQFLGAPKHAFKKEFLGWRDGSVATGTSKPDDLNLIPGTHMVEAENQLSTLSPDLCVYTSLCHKRDISRSLNKASCCMLSLHMNYGFHKLHENTFCVQD